MSQSKKSVVTNRKRAKSLTAVDIKKLIMVWPDRTIEELAVMFGVSNPPAIDRCEDGTGAGEAETGLGSDGARHINKSGRVLCQGVAARQAVMEQMRREYQIH